MINIVVYLQADGSILRCVTCPSEMADLQCSEGEAWLEHERVDDTAFKIDLDTLEIVPIS